MSRPRSSGLAWISSVISPRCSDTVTSIASESSASSRARYSVTACARGAERHGCPRRRSRPRTRRSRPSSNSASSSSSTLLGSSVGAPRRRLLSGRRRRPASPRGGRVVGRGVAAGALGARAAASRCFGLRLGRRLLGLHGVLRRTTSGDVTTTVELRVGVRPLGGERLPHARSRSAASAPAPWAGRPCAASPSARSASMSTNDGSWRGP